jgi:HAD superfamily hydrolase (TIGR01549 family)
MSRIRAVCFDVGYTLLDETRRWDEWAEWLKVKPEELWEQMRSVIAEGVHHVEALRRIAPGFDLDIARAERLRAHRRDEFRQEDLYPDVSPCLARLKAAGLKVGAAGNMGADVERFLERSGLGFDVVASSGRWGVEKPDPRFFARLVEVMATPADQLIYVGDRIDNDVRPAAAAGIRAVFVRRGPWAEILEKTQDTSDAYAVIDSLEELPGVIAGGPPSEGKRTRPKRSRKERPASR